MEIEGGDQHDMAYCRTPVFEQLRLVDVAGDQHESIAVMAYWTPVQQLRLKDVARLEREVTSMILVCI